MYSRISRVPYALSPKTILPVIVKSERTATATVQSLILPGVRYSFTGLPSASTTAWILVFLPPRESPISWFVSAFWAPFLPLPRVGEPYRRYYQWKHLAYRHRRLEVRKVAGTHRSCSISESGNRRFSKARTVGVGHAMDYPSWLSIAFH